ncbi:MAG: 3-oxoadipyl-CoA thiolase, partial [Bdellovibrionales bacterium]|nr:3-oxoadipyl-CoA thiolase [Bdellovibrionales bacterium]
MFKDSYITYAMRTPIGKFGGALASIRPDDLIAHLLTHYQQQDRHPLEEIDDVFIGCTNQVGEDSRNVARMALLLANYPYQVPGMTLNRLCGSSLEGVISAASRITAGLGECFLAGG